MLVIKAIIMKDTTEQVTTFLIHTEKSLHYIKHKINIKIRNRGENLYHVFICSQCACKIPHTQISLRKNKEEIERKRASERQ